MSSTTPLGHHYYPHPNYYPHPMPQQPNAQILPQTSGPQSADFVTISRYEYEHLLQASYFFKKLKKCLLHGGLPQENLDVLIYGTPQPRSSEQVDEPCVKNPVEHKVLPKTRLDSSQEQNNGAKRIPQSNEEYHGDYGIVASQSSDEKDYDDPSADFSTDPEDQRTVFLRGLPDRVVLQDIIEAVRGGALLHVYLRARDRTANVSFVERAAAQDFLQYTKTNGFYLAGKRVEVSWNNRQFYLPPYIGSKIKRGATRNLVIYKVNGNITESLIRKDLEHIHNLIVITVKFEQGNAYISTNSVHNALFARTCLMSRTAYKGMRIKFYADECADPRTNVHSGPKEEVQNTNVHNGPKKEVQNTNVPNGPKKEVQNTNVPNGPKKEVQSTNVHNGPKKEVQKTNVHNGPKKEVQKPAKELAMVSNRFYLLPVEETVDDDVWN